MKLRKRTPQQLAAQSEAAAEDTGVFEEESAPSGTVASPKVIAEDQHNPRGTALVEEVIGTLGRVNLFDADSLKALRATCKAFRDLVDSTGVTSTASFDFWPSDTHDLLERWAAGTRLIPHTRSLSIDGHVPAKLAEQVLTALLTHRPPITKLELDCMGAAAETLLTAPLDTLRELHLAGAYRERSPYSHSFNAIVDNTSISGLQSLSLEDVYHIDASGLAAVLARFRGLQSLSLASIDMKRTHVDFKVLQNALSGLETLYVGWCSGIDELGLLGTAGLALPALRTFEQHGHPMSTPPPWLGNLTTLILISVDLTSSEVVAALNGGPLVELHMHLGHENDAYEYWDWNGLELPHLTRLEVPYYRGDTMGDIARARLPLLRHAELNFDGHTSYSSINAFDSAFPELRELKMQGRKWVNIQSNGTGDSAALAAFRDIIPRLEYLSFSTLPNNPIALLNNILPAGPADGNPCWPRLRSLELPLFSLRVDVEKEAAVTIARAAPHFPALTSLHLGRMSPDGVRAFLAADDEIHALPLLHTMQVNANIDEKNIIPAEVHEAWPQVTLK